MIRVYNADEREYITNGDVVITPLRAHIVKKDNSDYYLDLECGPEYAAYLSGGKIILADTPQGDQPFRVANMTKTPSKITVKAQHVFYDAKNHLIEDGTFTELSCNDALVYLNGIATPGSPFSVSSDVSGVNSAALTLKSLCDAFFAVVETFGGHLVREGFSVSVKEKIGEDHGVVIRYGKNIKTISCVENWDDVVTRLLPIGKDGLTLPEKFIDAPDVTYPIPFCKTVTFDQDLADGTTQQQYVDNLREQATAYIKVNQRPKVNYTLSANVDQITDIGDTIEVIDDRLGGGTIPTEVIGYEWDCILKKYVNIEFGNFKRDLSGLITYITRSVNKTNAERLQAVADTLAQSKVTRSLSGTLTTVTADEDTIIPLDTIVLAGNKLSGSGTGVRIGAGVTKILVSARMTVKAGVSTGERDLKIVKKNRFGSETLASAVMDLYDQTSTVSINPTLATCQTGDMIYLVYNTPDDTDWINGGGQTSLTIETEG